MFDHLCGVFLICVSVYMDLLGMSLFINLLVYEYTIAKMFIFVCVCVCGCFLLGVLMCTY